LVEQLLSYFRDLAAVHVGCGPELLLQASEADHAALKTLAEQLGLETILAGVQILDTTLVRMKQSTHVRILGELALVRLCNLGQLDQLATLVAQLRQLPATAFTARPARAPESSTPQAAIPSRSAVEARPAVEETSSGPESPPAVERRAQSPREAIPERALPQESSASPSGQQKKNEILSTPPAPRREPDSSLPAVTLEEAQGYWQKTLAELVGKGEMAGDFAKLGTLTAISAPNTLVVTFQQRYNYQKSSCERADRKSRLESLLSELAGRTLALEFRLGDNDVGPPVKATAPPAATLVQKAQRRREVERHPLVRQAQELFEAAVEHVTEPVLESHVTPDVVVTEDT
jgi:DNA polymerase-3 subunit gamma/tau